MITVKEDNTKMIHFNTVRMINNRSVTFNLIDENLNLLHDKRNPAAPGTIKVFNSVSLSNCHYVREYKDELRPYFSPIEKLIYIWAVLLNQIPSFAECFGGIEQACDITDIKQIEKILIQYATPTGNCNILISKLLEKEMQGEEIHKVYYYYNEKTFQFNHFDITPETFDTIYYETSFKEFYAEFKNRTSKFYASFNPFLEMDELLDNTFQFEKISITPTITEIKQEQKKITNENGKKNVDYGEYNCYIINGEKIVFTKQEFENKVQETINKNEFMLALTEDNKYLINANKNYELINKKHDEKNFKKIKEEFIVELKKGIEAKDVDINQHIKEIIYKYFNFTIKEDIDFVKQEAEKKKKEK
jgi:hypothetical protein